MYRIEDLDDENVFYDYEYLYIVNSIIKAGHDCRVSKAKIDYDVEDSITDEELEALEWEELEIYKA